MRIGIDVTGWSNWRGFGRFTRSLVGELLRVDADNEYVLFFDAGYAACEALPARGRHVVVRTSVPQAQAIALDRARSWADLLRMSAAVARERLDLFFCPSIDGYFPLRGRARSVVTMHDTIPEEMGARMLPSRLARWRRRVKVRVALSQADRIVTGSERARAKICRIFGLTPGRVSIIPYGAAAIFEPPAARETVQARVAGCHGFAPPYLLHVGGFGPNKNLLVLVEAFAALRRDPRFEGVALVLVGRREDDAPYDESQALDRLIEDRGLAQRVIFTGRQSDQALRDLYQGAEALVVASLEEGFGLPGLEAVACGTPVVATVQSPLPDLLDGAVLPVDPHSPAGLHHAFATLLGNAPERERLRRGAVPLGPTLRWERSAREALRIFRDVATGHRAP